MSTAASTTCLESAQLGFVIFGAIFGTLLLCVVFLLLLVYWARSRQWVKFNIPGLERSLNVSFKARNKQRNGDPPSAPSAFATSRVHPVLAKGNKPTAAFVVDEFVASKDEEVAKDSCSKDSAVVSLQESSLSKAQAPNDLTVFTSTPVPSSNGNRNASTAAVEKSSSQPPSLPTGSPPSSTDEEEVVEKGNSVQSPNSQTPVASPKICAGSPVVRLRQCPVSQNDHGVVKEQEISGISDGNTEEQLPENCNQSEAAREIEIETKNAAENGMTEKAEKNGMANGSDYHHQEFNERRERTSCGAQNTNTILSMEQCGTLEANRKRLERERQQLRQLGII